MDNQVIIKIVQRAISSIRKNRSDDAINQLQQLVMQLERRVKEDDYQNDIPEERN